MSNKIRFIALGLLLLMPWLTQAAVFNKNNLLTDAELLDYDSMSLKRITEFLKMKGGALAKYVNAAKIIYDASQEYLISPKFIITTIQKESSLVTSGSITSKLLDWAMGFGVCDGCSKNDPQVKKYKGFNKQIDSALNQIRNGYLVDLESQGYTSSGWGPGITKKTLDGVKITPQNNATAVLYTYTPWLGYLGGDPDIGGNSSFWDIWQDWFPRLLTHYPNGSLLQDSYTGTVYLIKDEQKFAFSSRVALLASYNPNKIITVDPLVLDEYTDGSAIRFPNYTLLRSPAGTVYLYVDGTVRGIPSQKVLRQLGFNPEEIIDINWGELNKIPAGDKITMRDVYIAGALIQDEKGAVYYVDQDSVRHPIWSKLILQSRFTNRSIFPVNDEELQKFSLGAPVKLADGELITNKNDKAVYVISGGYKRPFQSKEVFEKMGYQWSNILYVSQIVLDLHPMGKPITLKDNQ